MVVVSEAARMEALRALHVLDTPPEERFDRVVRLAQRLFRVPLAAVGLLDEERQWFKAKVGFDLEEVPRRTTLCELTIQQPTTLVIPDARADDRFREHPAVCLAGLRFYAGHPLTVYGDYRVGTLCIADVEPHEFTAADAALLADLASWVVKELVIEDELKRAGAVQQGLQPKCKPQVAGYDLAGICLPTGNVGGDFFDWQLTGDQLQLAVADAMGKGLAAAITAAGVRALLKGLWHTGDLADAVNAAARGLEADFAESSTFVTLFCGRLDTRTHRLRYVDAGHGLAQIVSGDGTARRLTSAHLPLGVTTEPVAAEETHLEPGDTLICVSDGFLELFPKTADGLAAASQASLEADSAQDLVGLIAWHATRRPSPDDVTAVVLRRTG